MQDTIENNFFLTHRTIHHSKPTMTHTLKRLANHVAHLNGHTFTPGHHSSLPDTGAHQWKVQHAIVEGFRLLSQKKAMYSMEEEDNVDSNEQGFQEVDGQDIGAD